ATPEPPPDGRGRHRVPPAAHPGRPPPPLRAPTARPRKPLPAQGPPKPAPRPPPPRRSQARPDPRPSPDRSPPPTALPAAPPEPDSTRATSSQNRKNEDNEAPRECPTPLRQDRQRQPVPEAGARRGRRRGSEDRH